MDVFKADVVIIGAGGAGLRAAIAVAESAPDLKIALVSKVYPMRSHTVAAEGGSAGVVLAHDSLDAHFHDTVAGGDWLCEQDVVDYFVAHCAEEMVQLEHWGCPWSRKPDGHINVRAFGGMKIERTWFAADRTGFHILHTLFQTSLKYPSIKRFDEHFCVELLVEEGRAQGVVSVAIASGEFTLIEARAVIIATGGAGRVFRENTNGGIVTGDGMALAYRQGVPLRDMEFVQYHPTCMPGTGLLFTEACRGEGGFLLNKDGYRYLQDYGLGPAQLKPVNKAMELGPRDRLSQAFWHEQQKGRTIEGPHGSAVHLDLRHLGEKFLRERLPQIYELAEEFLGIDPATTLIPVRPAVHYTMGGITVNGDCAAPLNGLFAAGECGAGLHGANRLGGNSLSDLLVFGKRAGEYAAKFAKSAGSGGENNTGTADEEQITKIEKWALEPFERENGDSPFDVQFALQEMMQQLVGIVRNETEMLRAKEHLALMRQRADNVKVTGNREFNPGWHTALDLNNMLITSEAILMAALERKESRGAHFREDYPEKDAQSAKFNLVIKKNAEGQMTIREEPIPEIREDLKQIIEEMK